MPAENEIATGAASAATGMVLKSAPPAAVSGLTLLGYQMSDWVYVATLVWLVLQIASWGWDRFVKPRRDGAGKGRGRSKVFSDD